MGIWTQPHEHHPPEYCPSEVLLGSSISHWYEWNLEQLEIKFILFRTEILMRHFCLMFGVWEVSRKIQTACF